MYASGKVAEREEEETLALKVVQSAVERRPRLVAEAVGMLTVTVPPRDTGEPETLKSVPEEPVETVMEEFCSWLLPIVEVETKEVPL